MAFSLNFVATKMANILGINSLKYKSKFKLYGLQICHTISISKTLGHESMYKAEKPMPE